MAVPNRVLELIDLFDRNRDAYRSGKYKETQLRHEFVDPFFMTLGWDVNNEKGYAEAYKDVIHEDAIKVGGATKAPDYCFRIGGTRKFFLEAKKPSVDIKADVHPAYQLRRYAWTAKLPLSILTDFEEFAVYDCRVKPVKTDKASAARIQYVTYTDYPDRWDEIESIFSRDAVLMGSFDKYVESTKAKKGTAEVDTAFLKDIESWREMLARNIALRNADLTQRELNFAVQRTIDRIIFLRICEDRGVEIYGRLMALLNGDSVYKRLCQLFSQADDRYNSGLFHFRKEKERREPPDELTLKLAIDDKPLKDMIRHLYYPDSPYEFSVFPADILGQVYEQFLGKVIRLTAGHQAKVEDKPEVKKAGGVYYTPTYIVDYIVKNTVGRLLWDYPAEADGTCFMCKKKGRGAGDSGPGVRECGEEHEPTDQELQRSSSVARGHGAGSSRLQAQRKTARKREVRSEITDASSSRFGTCEYCGRTWIEPPESLPEPPVNSQGIVNGTGNLHPADDETPVRETGAGSRNSGSGSKSRKTAQRPYPFPETETLTSNPKSPAPKSPAPSPKSLTPTRVARLRILDPACGSGSFLIGAYQYLLDWHRDWYTNDGPEKWAKKRPPRVYQGPGGEWRLTTAERKRILLNNIYGVDIDPQAVEVTKLSLLLKVLEGESSETIGRTLELFHERALPDLGNNIKCGNSLIGPDFFRQGVATPCLPPGTATPCPRAGQQMTMFDDEERYRINAFDWKAEFPEIMCGDAEDLWFVTFVTHNSRVSERMVQFGVTDPQGKGLQPLVLTPEEQIAVAESLFDTARRHGFAFAALNVLPDHVHAMLPAADQKTLAARVRMLKIFSAQAINERRQRTKGAHVWAQKFNRKHIETENDAARIYDYINQNQLKHQETWGDTIIHTWDKGLQPLARRHCVIPGFGPVAAASRQGVATPCLAPDTAPSATPSRQRAAAPCLPPGAGFDVVIGNPPYGAVLANPEKHYLRAKYPDVPASLDSYMLFYVECLEHLLQNGGRLGYITPNTWELVFGASDFRRFVLENFRVEQIVHYCAPVFKKATVDCEIVIITKGQAKGTKVNVTILGKDGVAKEHRTAQSQWAAKKGQPFSIWLTEEAAAVVSKVESMTVRLQRICRIYNGVKPFEVGKGNPPQTKRVLAEKPFVSKTKRDHTFKPLLRGSLIQRYKNKWNNDSWISYGPWLAAPRDPRIFSAPEKIICRQTGDSIIATLIDDSFICRNNLHIILPAEDSPTLMYLLGILNSSTTGFYYGTLNPERGEALAEVKKKHLEQLPIRTINFDDPEDVARHGRMVELVEQMLSLHKQLAAAKTAHDKTVLQRQIDATDRQIDQLVYELYGLTDEEIKIVEETANA